MKFALLLTLVFSSPAFSTITDFEGSYNAVSGIDGTVGCVDFDITLDESQSRIKIIEAKGGYVVDDLPSINKGPIYWQHNWGDGITKGTQNNKFDGRNKLTQVIKTFHNLILYKKSEIVIEGDKLSIFRDYGSKKTTCILRKIK